MSFCSTNDVILAGISAAKFLSTYPDSALIFTETQLRQDQRDIQ
jgi:hypothetical protein